MQPEYGDHWTCDSCPECPSGDLYHQNMGRGKGPALVCDECDWVSWLIAICAHCEEVWS